jgi:hypothetical protein
VVLQTCTGGPAQQWSVNPNGTISDIQTGATYIGTSGGTLVSRGCSGAASQWTFTPSSSAPSNVEFTVTAAAAGTATLAIRYANGTATDRPASP